MAVFCMRGQSEDDEHRRRSQAIDHELHEHGKRLRSECKILLLGAGESGKSTIVKQMKIIHLNGFTKKELIGYRPAILANLLECGKTVVDAMSHLDIQPSSEATKAHCEFLDDYVLDRQATALDPKVVEAIQAVWNDPARERVLRSRTQFHLMDSAEYFCQEAARIAAPGYVPNETDVLRARIRTTSIVETRFKLDGINIRMFDVGGQRSERRKWIHCFENVTVIIFCVATSEYDQVLFEDRSQNRMTESLILFDSIVNSRWFKKTHTILFLNKIDIFKRKIKRSPMSDYFPDYVGGKDANKAAKYLLGRFEKINRSQREIYPHMTQATDTSNMRLVFKVVKSTILARLLKESSIII